MTNTAGGWAKRGFDLLVGIPLAIVSLPIIFVLALGSATVYRANPFFVQQRVGRHGTPFPCIKIRSLPCQTPGDADKYQLANVENHWFGRLIRRTHLDETPQILLVITGHMSLVGPRPEMVSLSGAYEQSFVTERTLVRPGCTGLWQVSSATVGLISEAPVFDRHYVRHWTVRLDIWILARTVLTMFGGSSIDDTDRVPNWTGAAVGGEVVPRRLALVPDGSGSATSAIRPVRSTTRSSPLRPMASRSSGSDIDTITDRVAVG